MREIQALGRRIGREFAPRQVVLFGSYARGTAGPDSDVDLLVVMPCEGAPAAKAAEVRLSLRTAFPVDVVVRSPEALRRRLRLGDAFLREVVEHGKVLYARARR